MQYHSHYSYSWQKAFEAMSSLVSDNDWTARLIHAGHALCAFPLENLPDDVKRKALVVSRAFDMYPWKDTTAEQCGTIAALIKFLPESRKNQLGEMVLSLFGSICEARGIASQPNFQARSDFDKNPALSLAEEWEFLFWNLTSGATASDKAQYIRYAHEYLPNFPADVLISWIGRHGVHGLEHWEHLVLPKLTFEKVSFTPEELYQVTARDEGFTERGPSSHGAYHLNRPGDWAGEFLRENGTWATPILVTKATSPKTSQYRIVDGHNRLCRLINLPESVLAGSSHEVWIMR